MNTGTMIRTLAALVLVACCAESAEKKVKMADLPPAVQKAVREQSNGATLTGLSREVENGVTLYEAELKVAGHTKDVTFDRDGKVVIVEEETTLDSIPPPAREAITKVVGRRKLLLVETVFEKGATFYEAHFRSGLRTREIKVDETGKQVN
jgi:hypothetical protein